MSSIITEPATVSTAAVAAEALTWPEQARALTITDSDSYLAAATMLKGIKALRSKISDTFGPLKAKSHAAWKAICDEEKKSDAPLTEAETLIKRGMSAYDAAQERLRREEEARLREVARRDAETRALAEAAALEQEALVTDDASLLAEAEALISEPVAVAPVIVPRSTPTVAGISYRETWKADITNLGELVKAAAANPQLLGLLQPNTTAINGMARALKSTMRVPGVRVYSERVVSAGAGR
jgi:hypothetical protein